MLVDSWHVKVMIELQMLADNWYVEMIEGLQMLTDIIDMLKWWHDYRC